MTRRREAVSVVTVWNDEQVRRACLDASLAAGREVAPGVEYVPVDNRGQRHSTAGAALNEGVRAATREVVAFVQQDIHLHSLPALEEAAAALLDDPSLWLVGAVGITADGRIRGRIRDRVVLIGDREADPRPVDSVDEVVFLARRTDLLDSPLSEDPALAWHAYAVEWGLRGRARGQQVVVMDIPLTHNSRSTNLARLDEAHTTVGVMHPTALPVHTTCGRIDRSVDTRVPERKPFLAAHRWRLRWAQGSLAARAARRRSGSDRVVLGDLRRDIDLIAAAVDGNVWLHNVTEVDGFTDVEGGLRLPRSGYDVTFSSGRVDERPTGQPGDAVICTNVSLDDLAALVPDLATTPHVIGYHDDTGYWVLCGDAAARSHDIWSRPQARPARLPV